MTKTTIRSLQKAKLENRKFATITAYDATFARLSDEAGIECLLVGDSLGNVIQGKRSTVPVTLEEMSYHTSIVAKGCEKALVMADMPFMSYTTAEKAMDAAGELMRSGAQMVKMEGATWLTEIVSFMSERGAPVCGHLGLLPQSVNKTGGYFVQGREAEAAEQILADALAYEQAGADMLLLECVPASLAKKITESVKIPVVGIGAGGDTDSQVLVVYDLLGLSSRIPSFVKNYLQESDSIQDALAKFGTEVRDGQFPGSAYTIA